MSRGNESRPFRSQKRLKVLRILTKCLGVSTVSFAEAFTVSFAERARILTKRLGVSYDRRALDSH